MKWWTLLLVMLPALGGCAADSRELSITTQAIVPGTIDGLLRRSSIGEDAAVRVDPLFSGIESSAYVVQLRTAEQRHLHLHHDVTIFIRRGRGQVYIDDIPRTARPGDLFHAPRGVPHWCVNAGDDPLVFIELYTPEYDGSDTIVAPREARSYEPQ